MPVAISADRGFREYRDKARFDALDGVRFLAIAAVLFQHSPLFGLGQTITPLGLRGFLGVDLFFVISGFLITSLLLRERDRKGRISLRGFYWRRALRILPLYLLVVTAVGGYYTLVKHVPGAAQTWPFYYLMMMNFITSHISLLAPTWSLAVEEQFYLFWPLLLVLVSRRALFVVIVGFVLAYAVFASLPVGQAQWHVGPLTISILKFFFPAMLLGSGLALLLNQRDSFALLWGLLGQRWSAPVFAGLLLLALLFLPVDLRGFPNLIMHLTMTALLGSLVIREDTAFMPVLTFAPNPAHWCGQLRHLSVAPDCAACGHGDHLSSLWHPGKCHVLFHRVLCRSVLDFCRDQLPVLRNSVSRAAAQAARLYRARPRSACQG